MSRRLYRSMAQARASLKDGIGVCLSPEQIVQSERETQTGIQAARARETAESSRIYHPAIPAPQHLCFRVVRKWTGEAVGEDIGHFRTEHEARALLRKELGWACVLNPNGRQMAINFQAMTERRA